MVFAAEPVIYQNRADGTFQWSTLTYLPTASRVNMRTKLVRYVVED